jgi:hypothetical protein
MSEAHDASVQTVLSSIDEPAAKASIDNLLKQTINAMQRLSGLDDTIYQCYKLDDAGGEFEAELDLTLTELRRRILGGTQLLVTYLTSQGWTIQDDEENQVNQLETIDFDFGGDNDFDVAFNDDFDAAFAEPKGMRSSPSLPSLPDLQDIDIDEAFGFLEPENQASTQEKIELLRDEITPISFALHDQINSFENRLRAAFHQANYSLAIRELDASRESLSEGLMALVTSIYRIIDGTEATSLDFLPGFRDNLVQALQAREGIARLTKAVNQHNTVVQNDDHPKVLRMQGILAMSEQLSHFLESHYFHAMQAPDRWELVNFSRSFKSNNFRQAAQACEGFAKYLESMAMMAPSEILINHDQEAIQTIHSSLGAIRSVAMVSPIGAVGMLEDVLEQCRRLYGKDPYIDDQLDQWTQHPPDLQNPHVSKRVVDRIVLLLR